MHRLPSPFAGRLPHRLPLLVAALAALTGLAAGVAGCATVTAPPPPRGGAGQPPGPSARADVPREPPAHQVLDTVGARPVATARPSPRLSAPSRSASAGHGRPHRSRRHAPRRSGAAPAVPSLPPLPRLPSGAGVCDLGREYGGWGAGGAAARACRRAVGPLGLGGAAPGHRR